MIDVIFPYEIPFSHILREGKKFEIPKRERLGFDQTLERFRSYLEKRRTKMRAVSFVSNVNMSDRIRHCKDACATYKQHLVEYLDIIQRREENMRKIENFDQGFDLSEVRQTVDNYISQDKSGEAERLSKAQAKEDKASTGAAKMEKDALAEKAEAAGS